MKLEQNMKPAGVFHLKHFRDGKQIGDEIISPNLVVTEGKDYIADSAFNNRTSAIGTWYMALFGNNRTPLITDTGATVAGLSGELNSEYVEGTRPAWVSNAASNGANSSNSDSPGVFTMQASDTIYGAFLISNSTKAGSSGTLLAESLFSASRGVLNGDVLQLTYEIELT